MLGEGGREGREGRMAGGREGGREVGEGGREGGRERGREVGREGGREGGRKEGREGGRLGGWEGYSINNFGVLLLRCAKKHNVGGYHKLAHVLLQKMLAALVYKRSPFRRYS